MVVARRVDSYRTLTDCRGLLAGGHTLADLYFLVDAGLDKDISREAVPGDADGEMAEKPEIPGERDSQSRFQRPPLHGARLSLSDTADPGFRDAAPGLHRH
jgi:hypothetical protein